MSTIDRGYLKDWYRLDGDKVVPLESMEEKTTEGRRVIGRTYVGDSLDGPHVSTVFLGLDHSYPRNPSAPLVFETMIFGLPDEHELSYWQDRYTTVAAAISGHANAVDLLRRHLSPPAQRCRMPGPRSIRCDWRSSDC